MKIAVLGPGGVGGLLAGLLDRAGEEVVVVARDENAPLLEREGISVDSVRFGQFLARPRIVSLLEEPVDALIVATKATGLQAGLGRVTCQPDLVLPLLNGLDHLIALRERFDPGAVLAGTIRVESDRPQPGVVVHTSQFLLVEMATHDPATGDPMHALAQALSGAGVSVRADWPISARSEADVMWGKLVRLNALACTTSAYDKLLGEIRSTPELRADLVGAIDEACAVGAAEGARDVQPEKAIAELERAHETLGSSMQRDIAAGRAPELDEIPGAVLRAGARHRLRCPTIERLVKTIEARIAAAR